jgi:hypothetical protein
MKQLDTYTLPGIVVGVAVVAAGYSLVRKLLVDKSMRLARQNRKE